MAHDEQDDGRVRDGEGVAEPRDDAERPPADPEGAANPKDDESPGWTLLDETADQAEPNEPA